MRYCLLLIGFLLSFTAWAEEESAATTEQKYIEGTHYQRMLAQVPTIVPADKVEIAEIFRFGCPACFKFEGAYQTWSETKPPFIEFVKNPVIWDKTTEIHAKVYFTAEVLGVEKEMAQAIFEAIHEKATTRKEAMNAMTDDEVIMATFEKLGADKDKAMKVYSSFGIKSKVNQADGRARAFAVSGTPEIVVDGQYRVTTSTAGSFEQMLAIATYLAEKAAKEKGLLE